MKSVGAYEAKTHLSELLDAVANGEVISITSHGVPVAVLAPPSRRLLNVGATIDAWLAYRANLPVRPGHSIRDMIDEGRKE